MDIVPAGRARDWMADALGHAHHCLPMTMANQSGWLLILPVSFRASWNGGPEADDLVLTTLDGDPLGPSPVGSHFGSGILSILPPFVFRTARGFNLRVSGVPNQIRDGVQALEGLVETDWAPMTFTMNYKLTRPDHPVEFRVGEAFASIAPEPRGVLERFDPDIQPISAVPDLARDHARFSAKRNFSHLRNTRSDGPPRFWDLDYKRGTDPMGKPIAPDHQTTLNLRPFRKS